MEEEEVLDLEAPNQQTVEPLVEQGPQVVDTWLDVQREFIEHPNLVRSQLYIVPRN